MIEVIKGLWQEYGGVGLVIAFIIFYIGGSWFQKSLIKWFVGTISTRNFLFRIFLIFLSATVLPFFLAIYSYFYGKPLDQEKLVEIFALKSGGIFVIVIFVFMFYFNLKKEIKLRDKIMQLARELADRKRMNKEKRQARKKRKQHEKQKKLDRKRNKK